MDYKSRDHVLKCPGAALDSPGRGTERKDLPMQHEPTATAAEDDDRIDTSVIHLLANPDQPWSEDEIIRELTGMDGIAVIDSLARLRGKGVIHRLNEFAFMTRAARESNRLTGCI